MSTLLGFLLAALLVIVFAVVAKRLLGAYALSPLRTFAAAIVGYLLGLGTVWFMVRIEDVDRSTAQITGLIMAIIVKTRAMIRPVKASGIFAELRMRSNRLCRVARPTQSAPAIPDRWRFERENLMGSLGDEQSNSAPRGLNALTAQNPLL